MHYNCAKMQSASRVRKAAGSLHANQTAEDMRILPTCTGKPDHDRA